MAIRRFLFSTIVAVTLHINICPISAHVSTDVNQIKFYLYPEQGNTGYCQEIRYNNAASLRESRYKSGPGIVTVFLVHGFTNNKDTPHFKTVTDAYINSYIGGNYIVMDWSPLAGVEHSDYADVVRNAQSVGSHLANFIGWLYASGVVDMYHVHLVGHSLGAHIVGEAGRNVIKNMNGFKLPRITGLDPAGPRFRPQDSTIRVSRDDAEFVDLIHTNGKLSGFGTDTMDGHVDVIVNDGNHQPGCNSFSYCSHEYANRLYARSFQVSYFACKCSVWAMETEQFQRCMRLCEGPVRVGLYMPHDTRGVYSLATTDTLQSSQDMLDLRIITPDPM